MLRHNGETFRVTKLGYDVGDEIEMASSKLSE